MECPKCNAQMMSKVYGTREVGSTVRRCRECTHCGHRYVTVEKVVGQVKPRGKG